MGVDKPVIIKGEHIEVTELVLSEKYFKQYTIERFEWKDVEKYFERIVDMETENTYKYHYPDMEINRDFIKDRIGKLKTYLTDNNNSYFIGVTMNNQICGYIWFYLSEFMGERIIVLNSIFICEGARRNGLAQFLFNELKQVAIENSCKKVTTMYAVINKIAGAFYHKNGLTPIRIEVELKLLVDTGAGAAYKHGYDPYVCG